MKGIQSLLAKNLAKAAPAPPPPPPPADASKTKNNGRANKKDVPDACLYFNRGKCNRGDKCPYAHVMCTPEELIKLEQRIAEKRNRSQTPKGKGKGDRRSSRSPSPFPKHKAKSRQRSKAAPAIAMPVLQLCQTWTVNRTCLHGDACLFSHATA